MCHAIKNQNSITFRELSIDKTYKRPFIFFINQLENISGVNSDFYKTIFDYFSPIINQKKMIKYLSRKDGILLYYIEHYLVLNLDEITDILEILISKNY